MKSGRYSFSQQGERWVTISKQGSIRLDSKLSMIPRNALFAPHVGISTSLLDKQDPETQRYHSRRRFPVFNCGTR